MKKLIFLVTNFFIKRDFDRLGIQYYLDSGVVVEVWDLTEALEKNFHNLIKPEDELKANYIKKFKNLDEIKKAFKDLKDNVFMSIHLTYGFDTLGVFKLLSKYKINYIITNISSPQFAIWENKKIGIIQKIYKFLKVRDLNYLLNYLKNFVFRNVSPKIFGVSSIPFLLVGGAIFYKKKNRLFGKSTKIIYAHHRDYDLHLKNKNNNEIKEKYDVVFMDQAAPFHNDHIRANEFINPNEYYNSLELFFLHLKKKYNKNTIICAHPRSNHELSKYISNIEIAKGRTLLYVKKCSFVICHDSLAINFAVIYKKPLVFIYNNALSRSTKYDHLRYINLVAGLFKKKPINVDNLKSFNLDDELQINEESYQQYFKNYIKFRGDDKTVPEKIKDLIYYNK